MLPPAAPTALSGTPIDNIVHVIQVSLAPAFLLSALATLLNVFSTRLGRVADKVDAIRSVLNADGGDAAVLHQRLAQLRQRSVILDLAVILASLGGATTGIAVLTLFVGALHDGSTANFVLYACFGTALVCTVGALAAFMFEILLAGNHIRTIVAHGQKDASER